MSADQSRIEAIFFAALEMSSPEDRAAYLDRACGGDQQLRDRVEELLQAESDDTSAFLRSSTDDNSEIDLEAGASIGPYRLIEQIGEGGFGVVYLAEQTEPIKRRVALKIIKPGMDTKEVVRRFETERQALALMEHPFIARVFDAGSTRSGYPYFVMELVDGVHITEYCDHHRLSIPQRLALFVQVCQAVQHAHQKEIIHRDLKPSNILITTQDGTPVPRIIDFGVAKALHQGLTGHSLITVGKRMLGTPLYMSPEQAEMDSADVDARSDVYSLGALLYQLLTGTTPFAEERMKKAGYDELCHMIRDEQPPTPSSRISTLGDEAKTVAQQRHADPRRLALGLRGDLDWIVMKALEKDRARRYQTARAMASDIERHLAGLPVEARPPSLVYRLQKVAQRNSGMLIAVVAILIVALFVSSISAVLIARQRDVARQATRDAERGRELALEERERAEAAEARASEEKENAERNQYYRTIEVAATRLKENRKGEVYDLLMAAPEQYRNWEWGYLLSQCQGEVHRAQAHPLCQAHFDLSADEKWLVSVSTIALTGGKYQIALWNAATMEEKWRRDVDYRAASVEIHPDNTIVAVGGWDCPLFIYDLETGEQRFRLSPDSRRFSLRFSPDGKVLVENTTMADTFVVRRAQNWETVTSFGGRLTNTTQAAAMAFSPDGRLFATGDHNGMIVIWDTGTWNPVWGFQGHSDSITDLLFDSTSTRLVSASWGNRVSVWDVELQDEIRTLALEFDTGLAQTAVELTPDDSRLYVAGGRGVVWCIGFKDGEVLGTLRTREGIGDISVSVQSERVYIGHGRGSISAWSFDSILGSASQEEPLGTLKGSGKRVLYSPDGKLLVGLSSTGRVEAWDSHSFEHIAEFKGGWAGKVRTMGFRPGTRELLLSLPGSARFYRIPETRVTGEIPLNGELESASMDASGRFLLIGDSGSYHHKLWDLEQRQVVVDKIPYASRFGGLIGAMAGDGTRGIVGAENMTDVSVYRFPEAEPLYTKEGDSRLAYGGTRALAFHPNNRIFALADSKGYIYIRSTESDEVLGMLITGNQRIDCLSFNPDGSRLLMGRRDGEFQLWDWTTGQKLLDFKQPSGPEFSADAAFSPDGMSIAITGVDPPFRVLKALPWGANDPTVMDSDHDGLTDAEETRIGMDPIIADTEPPTVRLVGPTEFGELFGGEQLTFTADIRDDGRVAYADLLVDGELAASDCLAPYTFEWTVPVGARAMELAVVATDTNGNRGTSQLLHLEVLPDPMTTAVGRVVFGNGRPVPGARVTTAFGQSVRSGPDGEFSIPDVKTAYGPVVVGAAFGEYFSESVSTRPVRNGITEIGDIVLNEPFPILEQVLRVGQSPCAIVLSDLNRDSYQDIVVGHWESDFLSVMKGNGRGRFVHEFLIPLARGVFSVVTVDLNRDSIPDLVTTCAGRDGIALLRGIGNGDFEEPYYYDVGDNPLAVEVADLNGDDYADIVTANYRSDDVSVLMGTGGGGFEDQRRIAVGDGPASVIVLDTDRDGISDLVVANRESDNLSVFTGLGDGTFESKRPLQAGAGPTFLVAEDLNGDGIPDLAVANRRSENISILIANREGGFRAAKAYALEQSPRTLTLADLNRDGVPDIVSSNLDSSSLSFLLGNGDGTFDVLEPWECQHPHHTISYETEYGSKPLLLTTHESGNSISILSPGPVKGTMPGSRSQPSTDIPWDGSGELVWSSFLGGEEADIVSAVATDGEGNFYVAGLTSSPDFPVTAGAFDVTHNGPPGFQGDAPEFPGDAYLAKFDGRTGALVFGTFLGGTGQEGIRDIHVLDSGEIIVAGMTTSADFPTTSGAYDESHNGEIDVFVSKLSVSGNALVYSTFLGGSGTDQMPLPEQTRIAVDSLGNVYLTGETSSADFPTTPGAYQTKMGSAENMDAFVAKLSADGATLVYSTFLGGHRSDEGRAVAVDNDGQAFVVGMTRSSDFPVTDDAYPHGMGGSDAFVTKLTADGRGLVYSTCVGGSANDTAVDVLLDARDEVFVAGWTRSDDFPTTNGAYSQTHSGGDDDVFVLKLNAAGNELLASTLLGGSGNNVMTANMSRDVLGNVWISGSTSSPEIPVTIGTPSGRIKESYLTGRNTSTPRLALYEALSRPQRPYVAQLDGSLTALLYATAMEGGVPGLDGAFSVADGFGNVFVAGATVNARFPITDDAFDNTFGGDGAAAGDAFIMKIHRSTVDSDSGV